MEEGRIGLRRQAAQGRIGLPKLRALTADIVPVQGAVTIRSSVDMIIGDRRAGRKLLALVVIIGTAIILTAALFVHRKRTAPQNEPPLHSRLAAKDLVWRIAA